MSINNNDPPKISGALNPIRQIDGLLNSVRDVGGSITYGNGLSNDYNDLYNKPQIESHTLIGNQTFEELGMLSLTNTELESLLK